jgi:hypothetical protein
VERGFLWLVSGVTSLWGEMVPPGIIGDDISLQPPPDAIMPAKLLPSVLPGAWSGDKASALSLLMQLSSSMAQTLPWKAVRDVIASALAAHFLEIADSSQTWPCDLAGAQFAHFRIPTTPPPNLPEEPKLNPNVVMVSTKLEGSEVQNLGDVVNDLLEIRNKYSTAISFNVRVELGDGKNPPPPEAIQKVNALLKTVKGDMQLK